MYLIVTFIIFIILLFVLLPFLLKIGIVGYYALKKEEKGKGNMKLSDIKEVK